MIRTNRINSESIIEAIFHLKWKSHEGVHTDAYHIDRLNIWRDYLPPMLLKELLDKGAGDRFQMPLEKGSVIADFTVKDLLKITNNQFDCLYNPEMCVEPRLGRFYPKGMLKGVTGVYKSNVQPFRCVGLENGHITVDFNHPLSGKMLELSAVIGKVSNKNAERGGTSIDWMETLTTGPGMQARWRSIQTDYFSNDAFKRDDNQPDTRFYQQPRFVSHIDDTAREMIRNTYGRFLTDGMHVLDLMSSWQSHIPDHLNLDRVVGLGLNKEELKKNPQLTGFLVQDLNTQPILPFEAGTFDAVFNTVSIEYLIDPLAIYNEVSRVLRPNGVFIVTFSNRWFPTKSIKIWKDLHEFERMGLVLEYFMRSKNFKDLQTHSIRGLPRPREDKYYPDLQFSDPIFAVWGRKKKGIDP